MYKLLAKGLFIVSTLLSCIVAVQHISYKHIKQEHDAYKNNTYSLLEDIEVLRQDSISNAYQVRQLRLDLDEYKQYRAEDTQMITDLKLKLKQVSEISKQKLEVQAPIKTDVRDTIVIKEFIEQPAKVISLINKHISFHGTIQNDSLTATVNVPIQITQIVHKVPKYKFLWWSWGCKAIKQVVVTDNPYVHLKYSEFIKVK